MFHYTSGREGDFCQLEPPEGAELARIAAHHLLPVEIVLPDCSTGERQGRERPQSKAQCKAGQWQWAGQVL